jgi:hypothetical protein
MYGRQQEDVAWTRLKDMQREMENSRLYGERLGPSTLRALWTLVERAWWLAGLAHRRAPRRSAALGIEECDAAQDVA